MRDNLSKIEQIADKLQELVAQQLEETENFLKLIDENGQVSSGLHRTASFILPYSTNLPEENVG